MSRAVEARTVALARGREVRLAVDDPASLARAARIVRAALARRQLAQAS